MSGCVEHMGKYLFVKRDDPNFKIDDEYIKEVEARYSFSFPDILRDYYLKHNGCDMYETRFEKFGIEFCVIFLYDLRYGKMPVEKVLEYNKDNDGIPSTFVPLAQDEDTDDFYWDSSSGKVYFLSLSNIEHPKEICGSVEEFIQLINDSVK